jgi:hypothetical protein
VPSDDKGVSPFSSFRVRAFMIFPAAKALAQAALQASPAILVPVASPTACAILPTVLPPLLPSAAAAALTLVGGGSSALDLGRVKLRLDGLHTYGVITSLLMNASLRLFSATPKRFETKDAHVSNTVKAVFSVMVATSVLSGSYTTIVFSLLGLYAKRALGRGMDAEFVQFFAASQPMRELAYDTFLVSLVSFQISFCLSLFLTHDEGMNYKLAVFGGVLALACWWKWSTVMMLAKTILKLGTDM